jgi:hypothetical protein
MSASDYYLQYLEDIDVGGYEVSKWEADFLDNMLRARPQQMSEKQQETVRRMVEKYLGEMPE